MVSNKALRKEKYKMQLTLKAARTNRGLTQEQLSKEIGVTADRYKRWEAGKNDIPAKSFIELCRVLGYSVDDIILPIISTKSGK
jgi:transcriptional regulator with XRE-family HTH domain